MPTPKYNLEERLTNFSKSVIDLCKKVDLDTINKPLVAQLVRFASSIGANYCEANGASSKKDFKNKIYICKKESIETKYWLRILSLTSSKLTDECRSLWKEAQEYTLIFSKILGTLNRK